jgi:hypothetical protein
MRNTPFSIKGATQDIEFSLIGNSKLKPGQNSKLINGLDHNIKSHTESIQATPIPEESKNNTELLLREGKDTNQ